MHACRREAGGRVWCDETGSSTASCMVHVPACGLETKKQISARAKGKPGVRSFVGGFYFFFFSFNRDVPALQVTLHEKNGIFQVETVCWSKG